MGNLYDFNPDTEDLKAEEMLPFDRWILKKCSQVGQKVIRAYQNFEYHVVFHTIYNFFTVELSSYYLDVIKDRVYCSQKDSHLRKSAQSALFKLLKMTLVLMSPILSFTAEEAWEALPDYKEKGDSVHLEFFPDFDERWMEGEEFSEWEKLGDIRENVLKKLEEAREKKIIGNSLEAQLKIHAAPSFFSLLKKYQKDLSELFIVSSVSLEDKVKEEIEVNVERVKWKKCERCWNYSPEVGSSKEYPELCKRCQLVVSSIKR